MRRIAVLLHLALELSFAANRENIILHADGQILRLHIRQVRLNHQFIFGLVDVHCRGLRRQVRLQARVSYAFAKHAIDLFLQASRKTVPDDQAKGRKATRIAQLVVARKLLSHAMDHRQKGYLVVENEHCTAP